MSNAMDNSSLSDRQRAKDWAHKATSYSKIDDYWQEIENWAVGFLEDLTEYRDDLENVRPNDLEQRGWSGIPTMLFPTGDTIRNCQDFFLTDILGHHQECVDERLTFEAMIQHNVFTEKKILFQKLLENIWLTHINNCVHTAVGSMIFKPPYTIDFGGHAIHDLPPVVIRLNANVKWTYQELQEQTTKFLRQMVKYNLLIDAYKFTFDQMRIDCARNYDFPGQIFSETEYRKWLLSRRYFLQDHYLETFRCSLKGRIAHWLSVNKNYWTSVKEAQQYEDGLDEEEESDEEEELEEGDESDEEVEE